MSGELEEFSAAISGISSELTEMPRSLPRNFTVLPLLRYPGTRSESNHKCPGCGIGLSEILESRLVGCARCYGFFAEELSEALDMMNFTDLGNKRTYSGTAPRSYRQKLAVLEKIKQLKDELSTAVSDENFELCATLRDKIREMEKSISVR